MSDLKITLCSIVPPAHWGDTSKLRVELGDSGNMQELFDFFSDELVLDPSEFVGLTIAEAFELKRSKDEAYLRAPGTSVSLRQPKTTICGYCNGEHPVDQYGQGGGCPLCEGI